MRYKTDCFLRSFGMTSSASWNLRLQCTQHPAIFRSPKYDVPQLRLFRHKAVTSWYGIWKLFSFFLPICFFFLAALIGQHDLFHHQLHLIIAGLCLFCQFLHLILKTEKQKKIYLPKVHFRFWYTSLELRAQLLFFFCLLTLKGNVFLVCSKVLEYNKTSFFA